ncbi:YrzI family small protein [Fictibacillus aquaticus]|nr:YrzI family small protein [Fictibacillus aquaticus]
MFTLNLLFVSITVSFKKKEMTYSDYNDQKRIKGLYESMRDKSANHISMF